MRLVSVVTRTRCVRAGAAADLVDQVVDLARRRPDQDLGVDQPGGADDLLDHAALRLLQLVGARRGRDVDSLPDAALELGERQRAVVQGRGQSEAVLDQRLSCASGRHGTCRGSAGTVWWDSSMMTKASLGR